MPSINTDPLQLISRKSLCKLLDVKPPTLALWLKRGFLPEPIRITQASYMWRRFEIEAWLEKQKKNKPPKARTGHRADGTFGKKK